MRWAGQYLDSDCRLAHLPGGSCATAPLRGCGRQLAHSGEHCGAITRLALSPPEVPHRGLRTHFLCNWRLSHWVQNNLFLKMPTPLRASPSDVVRDQPSHEEERPDPFGEREYLPHMIGHSRVQQQGCAFGGHFGGGCYGSPFFATWGSRSQQNQTGTPQRLQEHHGRREHDEEESRSCSTPRAQWQLPDSCQPAPGQRVPAAQQDKTGFAR